MIFLRATPVCIQVPSEKVASRVPDGTYPHLRLPSAREVAVKQVHQSMIKRKRTIEALTAPGQAALKARFKSEVPLGFRFLAYCNAGREDAVWAQKGTIWARGWGLSGREGSTTGYRDL